MRIEKTKLYKFNELTEQAQQKAIKNYNTEMDYEFFNDDFNENIKERLAEAGFINTKCYEWNLSCLSRPYIKIESVYIDLDKFLKPSQKWIKDIEFTFNNGEIDFNYGDKISKRTEQTLNNLKEKIQAKFDETISNLIKWGLKDIEYIKSDEAKKDNMEANEYEFLESGERW